MNLLHCLIVDDEPIARDIIDSYCKHLNYLKVVALCGNALEAKTILQNEQIDILFLDINMPVIDGMSFAKTLKNKVQIIFSTAYKEYATDAFDLEACDYLLKPFSFERFLMAVEGRWQKSDPQTLISLPRSHLLTAVSKRISYLLKQMERFSRYCMMICSMVKLKVIIRG